MSVCVYIYSYSYRHTLLINFLIAIINKDASIHFQQERLTTSIYTLPFAQPRFSILSSPLRFLSRACTLSFSLAHSLSPSPSLSPASSFESIRHDLATFKHTQFLMLILNIQLLTRDTRICCCSSMQIQGFRFLLFVPPALSLASSGTQNSATLCCTLLHTVHHAAVRDTVQHAATRGAYQWHIAFVIP